MLRTDVLNLLISSRNYSSYLEIGVNTVAANFSHVDCKRKVSVDPAPTNSEGVDHLCTSDEFFEKNTAFFDLIFIDGLHEEDQVDRDISNSLSTLNPCGAIVIHDSLPPSKWHQRPHAEYRAGEAWTGTVWKSVLKAFSESQFRCYIVDDDWGCAVIDAGHPRSHGPLHLKPTLTYDRDFSALAQFKMPPNRFIRQIFNPYRSVLN